MESLCSLQPIHNASCIDFTYIICCDRNLLYFLQFLWMQLQFGDANLWRSSSVPSWGSNQCVFMFEGLTDWPMHAVEADMMLMDLPTILFSMHQSWHGNRWTIIQFPHLAPFFMCWKLHLPYRVVIGFMLEMFFLNGCFCNIQNALKSNICPISLSLSLLHHLVSP